MGCEGGSLPPSLPPSLTFACHRVLLPADGGGGIESDALDDVLAVGDVALHAPAAISADPAQGG